MVATRRFAPTCAPAKRRQYEAMTRPSRDGQELPALTDRISEATTRSQLTVAVAESLTCGLVASKLGAIEGSGQWFNGGVIAYTNQVKYKVLGVDPGPVITASCAQQMARGVAGLTGSDLGLATTGVGGPGPSEGKHAGTVFIAVWSAAGEQVAEYHFPGEPGEVLQATTLHALRMVLAALEGG
jgi:nicotinamide-nucleotide amidase